MRNVILAFLAGYFVCIATITLNDLLYERANYERLEPGYFTEEAEKGICYEEYLLVPEFELWEA